MPYPQSAHTNSNILHHCRFLMSGTVHWCTHSISISTCAQTLCLRRFAVFLAHMHHTDFSMLQCTRYTPTPSRVPCSFHPGPIDNCKLSSHHSQRMTPCPPLSPIPPFLTSKPFAAYTQTASLALSQNRSASIIVLCPDELLQCLQPLQLACSHATCLAEKCDVMLMANTSNLSFQCPTASFWLFSHTNTVHFYLTRLHSHFGHHLKSCHGVVKKQRFSPLSVPASACSKYFVDKFQKEVEVRRHALNPSVKKTPQGKHFWWQKPQRDWQSVYRFWDRINQILHLAPFSWVRKIAALRRVDPSISVLRDGVWIYVLDLVYQKWCCIFWTNRCAFGPPWCWSAG